MDIEIIWEQFHKPLQAFVSKRVSDAYAVEDIVQDIFLKISTHLHSIKDTDRIQSWIYRTARNAIIDYYRKRMPTDPLPFELEAKAEEIGLEEHSLSKELSTCIRPMISSLPDKYRMALEYTELKGMNQKDLSVHLGLSISGAKSRVQRGREKLKEFILACCRVEADRYGNIIDYQPQQAQCGRNSCGCET